MIATTEVITHQSLQGGSTMVTHRASVKRSSDEIGEIERVTPTKRKKRTRHVSWADKNSIQIQPDNRKLFNDYNDEDIWYTVSPSCGDDPPWSFRFCNYL